MDAAGCSASHPAVNAPSASFCTASGAPGAYCSTKRHGDRVEPVCQCLVDAKSLGELPLSVNVSQPQIRRLRGAGRGGIECP